MIRGQGLHTGTWGSVAFEPRAGEVHVRAQGIEVPLRELTAVATERSTTIGNDRVRVATLEHVLAALGGLGIHDGVTIVIEGAEAPLADGGARAYASELLDYARAAPSLRVVRDGVIEVAASRYEFSCGPAPRLEVEIDFERLERTAVWPVGDAAADFLARIAPARTFGFEREVNELLAKGLASHVTPESVVVIGEDRVLSSGAPFSPDEPARHKLLDLIGDLYLHGGPPIGTVSARRPGHAATHEAIRLARNAGFVA